MYMWLCGHENEFKYIGGMPGQVHERRVRQQRESLRRPALGWAMTFFGSTKFTEIYGLNRK